MNTETHQNGCHNRKPYREILPVADGYFMDGVTRYAKLVPMKSRMKPDCQYTHTDLGQSDAGCSGGKWRKVPVQGCTL